MDLVVDASVVVKWFVEEHGSEKAKLVMEDFAAQAVELRAPALLPFEVLNALRYHPGFSEERLLSVEAALERFAFHEHALRGEYARRAVQLSHSSDLAIYDASYLALARTLGVKLVTADQALVRVGGPDTFDLEAYTSVGEDEA